MAQQMLKSFYEMLVLETHVDLLGHMNNATYLQILEEARWDLITRNGYGLPELVKQQKAPVILSVNLEFKKELRLREKIKIETQMLEYPSKVGKLRQVILKEDGSVSAEATMAFGLFDLKNRKLIDPTPEWLKAIGML